MFPLKIRGAMVSRKGKVLLGPLDLELGAGGLTAVIGPNGAGKTTLLRLMHGMERSSGTCTWAVGAHEARSRQAYVFQTPIMMRRSVIDNLTYPLQLRRWRRRRARDRATQWLERIGLLHAAGLPARSLSGGEKQLLALARALIGSPELLLLDEPSASLDGQATRAIEQILIETRDQGTRIVLATHDLGQARRLANDILFLHRGRMVETGPAQVFFEGPQTQAAQRFTRGEILD